MLYRVVVNVILRVSVWKNPEELPVDACFVMIGFLLEKHDFQPYSMFFLQNVL